MDEGVTVMEDKLLEFVSQEMGISVETLRKYCAEMIALENEYLPRMGQASEERNWKEFDRLNREFTRKKQEIGKRYGIEVPGCPPRLAI